MDILERLLKYDMWTTRYLLTQCNGLAVSQLNMDFDIGHKNLFNTLFHIVWNIEVWTDLMNRKPARNKIIPDKLQLLITRYGLISVEFYDLALTLASQNRLEDIYVDTLDFPPTNKTYGGTIAHVLAHNAVHRSEVLHIMKKLGVEPLIEGDVLSWEMQHMGI